MFHAFTTCNQMHWDYYKFCKLIYYKLNELKISLSVAVATDKQRFSSHFKPKLEF